MVQSRKKKNVGSEGPDKEQNDESSPVEAHRNIMTGARTEDNHTFDSLFGEVEDYAIVLLDPTGKILSWNRGAEKINGYAAKDIIGKNYRIFYTGEDKQINFSERLLEEAGTKGRTDYEGWRVRRDGSRFWGSMTLTALHNADGTLRGYLKITRDLTERKRAEDNYSNFIEELKLKNEELKKSEERYHNMIDEVMDYAIILLDKDGKILDWNKGAEKLKGYTSKEIIGKTFRLFYPKDEKEAGVPDLLLAEASEKGSITHEGWRIRKDGTRFWGNVTLTALHDANGEIIGFSKVTRDFTQRKVAEDKVGLVLEELRHINEELKQSEERYHRMIAEVQDYAIILLDKNGVIQNWNAGAEQIKGYQSSEIVGENFRIFYPEQDRKNNLPEKLLDIARKEGKATHEGWRLRKDGSRFFASIVITALHNTEGDVIGFSKVTRDLTEKKQADEKLKANAAQLDLKNKTLERLNEELSSFTRVASHDLKEPLRKIQTFVSRIEDTKFDPDKSRDFVAKIRSTAAGMQNLIEDLLSYSQVSSDLNTLTFERTDLNMILADALTDLEVSIHESKAVIDSEPLPSVRGIPYQLRQLFLNLLSNSIKFCRPDNPPHIVIKSELIKGPDIPGQVLDGGNKYHHISIADNGIGFPQHYSDKIFEAFQRLHPRSVFAGSGIGLAIVKKVMENHNGIVSADSIPDAGATFHLYFPTGA